MTSLENAISQHDIANDNKFLHHKLETDVSDIVAEYMKNNTPPKTLKRAVNRALKRGMDIALESIGLVVSSPLIIGMALATRYDSGTPSFFSQKRIGHKGKAFELSKIRVMHNGAEEKILNGEVDSTRTYINVPHNSPVYTRLGRFLDKWHLNEFPQLFYVVSGKMSFVGPRPMPVRVAQGYISNPRYAEKFIKSLKCKPGLIDYTTIRETRDISDTENVELRAQYSDIHNNGWTVLEDIKIIGKTMAKYLSGMKE